MPIRAVAIAEMGVAIALTVWRLLASDIEGPGPFGVSLFCAAALLNAALILWCARQGPARLGMLGLALAALGGAALLLLAACGIWIPWLFPWDGNLSGLPYALDMRLWALELTAGVAGFGLLFGWGLVLVRWWRGRRLAA